MEMILLFMSVMFLFIFIFVKARKQSSNFIKLPPAPRTLPMIGNLHQLISGPLLHQTLTDMAIKYGPIMHLKLGELSTIVVSSAEIAKEIMCDYDVIFAYRPSTLAAKILFYNCSDIAFSPYGDYWRQLRKICTMELLSTKRVQDFKSIREEEVHNMIRNITQSVITRDDLNPDRYAANVSKMIFSLTYSITARAAFGKNTKYQNEFLMIMEDVTKLIGSLSIADMYPSLKIVEVISGMRYKLEKMHKKIDQIMGSILDEHKQGWKKSRNREGMDIVDVLLDIQKSGDFGVQLTDDNIKAVIFDIFSAGGEPSATTSIWAMSEMIKNPRVLKRAQKEVREVFGDEGNVNELFIHKLKYLQAVIKETMRLHPPLPLLLPRELLYSKELCKINGYDIPKKARIIINAMAIGRDPMHWIEPNKFKPERFLDSEIDFKGTYFCYIPFGAGRRICPGMSFAIPNIELLIAQLLYHFDWKLPNRELDMAEKFGLAVGRKNDLELIPIPYSCSSIISTQKELEKT